MSSVEGGLGLLGGCFLMWAIGAIISLALLGLLVFFLIKAVQYVLRWAGKSWRRE